MPLLSDTFAFACAGGAIAVAVTLGQSIYLKRRWIELGTFLSGGFGIIAGAISGAIANVAYNVVGPNDVTRVLAWGLVGLLIGFGLSFRIPNLGRVRSAGAGLVGGILGGILTEAGEHWSAGGFISVLSFSVIGFLIALMIVIGDTLFREAWLEVHYGPRESRTISLGEDPVRIGGDANSCAVFVRGAPPVARTYTLQDRKIVCEDATNGRRTFPAVGTTDTIGNVTIVVHGG